MNEWSLLIAFVLGVIASCAQSRWQSPCVQRGGKSFEELLDWAKEVGGVVMVEFSWPDDDEDDDDEDFSPLSPKPYDVLRN